MNNPVSELIQVLRRMSVDMGYTAVLCGRIRDAANTAGDSDAAEYMNQFKEKFETESNTLDVLGDKFSSLAHPLDNCIRSNYVTEILKVLDDAEIDTTTRALISDRLGDFLCQHT